MDLFIDNFYWHCCVFVMVGYTLLYQLIAEKAHITYSISFKMHRYNSFTVTVLVCLTLRNCIWSCQINNITLLYVAHLFTYLFIDVVLLV